MYLLNSTVNTLVLPTKQMEYEHAVNVATLTDDVAGTSPIRFLWKLAGQPSYIVWHSEIEYHSRSTTPKTPKDQVLGVELMEQGTTVVKVCTSVYMLRILRASVADAQLALTS